MNIDRKWIEEWKHKATIYRTGESWSKATIASLYMPLSKSQRQTLQQASDNFVPRLDSVDVGILAQDAPQEELPSKEWGGRK